MMRQRVCTQRRMRSYEGKKITSPFPRFRGLRREKVWLILIMRARAGDTRKRLRTGGLCSITRCQHP